MPVRIISSIWVSGSNRDDFRQWLQISRIILPRGYQFLALLYRKVSIELL